MQEAQRPQHPPRKFEVDDFDEKAIFLCQFCGGASCDQENYLTNKIQPNAIEGLHSNWITPDILAMQRPSERLIKQFSLYQKFKDNNIRTVLNLQEPGEHPYCGDGIFPTVGFSYIPENFYSHGIRCFNESWEDMTATTFEHMMKIMNLFDLTISEGAKISVHCHAGRGRTLLVICSWLIYYNRMPAVDTISLAVAKRQGVLTRSSQRQFLVYFEEELNKRWRSYGVTNELQYSFTQFVEWQTGSLLNKEKKLLHKTPYAHFKLVSLIRKGLSSNSRTKWVQALLSPHSPLFQKKWSQAHEKTVTARKTEMNKINFAGLEGEDDPRIISELLLDFYDELPYTIITGITVECMQELIQKNSSATRLSILLDPAIVHDLGISGLAVILDFCHLIATISRTLRGDNEKMEEVKDGKVDEGIEEALFVRVALLLLSKRKYFPLLFPPSVRDCKIYKYISKIGKAVNLQVLFLAAFFRQLAKQLPEELEDVHRIIFKACKVDSNLYYLTNQSPELLSKEKKEEIYNSARIKLT